MEACFHYNSYEKLEAPEAEEANAYLKDGNTLIISAVRNKEHSLEQRKNKIKWLISHGADVNKCDCSRRYFPPVSHAVQMGDYGMFLFLLEECKANSNVGSRNPHDSGKLRKKNEGNMPLMIAAWEGKDRFVETLCKDERTSINQQDANGFTALMKASMNGKKKCMDILTAAGADRKIVDIEGKTAADWYKEYLDIGPMRKQFERGSRKNSAKKGKKR